MKVCTPEELLGFHNPKVCSHHGNCCMCQERLTLVLHFNYDKQPEKDFKICKKCLKENFKDICNFLDN